MQMMQANTSILPETAATRYDVAAFRDVSYEAYHAELRTLRRQLLRMQEWALREGQRIVVVLEGRDAAGKGTTASAITRYLNPKSAKIISQGIPTPRDMRNWLGIHYRMMPEPGNIVVFDRSWYSRALIQPSMGYCTMRQYDYFMNRVNDWEKKLVDEGIAIVKIYLSVSRESQDLRFKLRLSSELQYWKYSANDRKVAERWQLLTYFKERMFAVTSTDYSPWVIIESDNKHQAVLNAIHYLLSRFEYDRKELSHELPPFNADALELTDMIVDGVLFPSLNSEQVAILERILIHE
jgi:polyphosphate kinase 2 (PPK2 family)